jgi:hypothetical protein
MKEYIGRVVEVYLPEQYKNGNLLDVMDRTNIGFKVMTEDGLKDIVVDQNEDNAKIMKKDIVVITEQEVSGKVFTDIELYDGEDYE